MLLKYIHLKRAVTRSLACLPKHDNSMRLAGWAISGLEQAGWRVVGDCMRVPC